MAKTKTERTSPIEYYKQVRAEMKRVTWPSRHETTVSTIAVFVMVFLASVLLYVSYQIIAYVIQQIMSFGM